MKKLTLILIFLFLAISLFAQEKMYIHKSDNVTLGALISPTDSIYFNSDKSIIFLKIADTLAEYPLSKIDSLSFGPNSDTVFITYHDTWVSVINPLAFEGVCVDVNGTNVTVIHSLEIRDVNYCLSGITNNGSFKIYSEKRFNLILNKIDMTNPDGPAINSQSNNKVTVILADGSSNNLSDGTTYSAPPNNNEGEEEDQKACFFSEGEIDFKGTGSLIINGTGTDKHALCSDEDIQIESGHISITSTGKDGIHGKEGFFLSGGSLNIISDGDGIDGDEGNIEISGGELIINCSSEDVSGIKCDSTLTISGGNINITINGNQSEGLKSYQELTLSGGTININTTGAVVLNPDGSGYNPSYCSAIKGEGNITINGSQITLTCTGIAGKGISCDKDLAMTSGNLQITTSGNGATYKNSTGQTDVYQSTCISGDAAISLLGGTVTTYSSGSAGRGISSGGTITIGSTVVSPSISVTTTGTSIQTSSSQGGWPPKQDIEAAEAKAIKSNGDVTINSCNLTISSADDGIKSTTSITMNGGNVSIVKSVEGIESPNITVNGGNLSIVSTDDGFNATYGNGAENDDNSKLILNGAYILLDASTGDPLDSNGDMDITGGTVIVHGPKSQPEVGMDVNGTKNISGGFLVVSGTNSFMTEAMSTSSGQYSVLIKSQQSISNSSLFHIQDASGNDLVTFKPVRNYYSIIFSSPELKSGGTYSIYTGGSSTGTLKDGLYTGGTYSGGTMKKTFTIQSKVTNVTM
ncbi:MAG: carbohydrate-binding domain-containing protein [bacterium]